MKPSDAVMLAIKQAGKKQADLTELGFVNSAQAANRKVANSTWTLAEIMKVAEWTGSKLFFQTPDGERYELK